MKIRRKMQIDIFWLIIITSILFLDIDKQN